MKHFIFLLLSTVALAGCSAPHSSVSRDSVAEQVKKRYHLDDVKIGAEIGTGDQCGIIAGWSQSGYRVVVIKTGNTYSGNICHQSGIASDPYRLTIDADSMTF